MCCVLRVWCCAVSLSASQSVHICGYFLVRSHCLRQAGEPHLLGRNSKLTYWWSGDDAKQERGGLFFFPSEGGCCKIRKERLSMPPWEPIETHPITGHTGDQQRTPLPCFSREDMTSLTLASKGRTLEIENNSCLNCVYNSKVCQFCSAPTHRRIGDSAPRRAPRQPRSRRCERSPTPS